MKTFLFFWFLSFNNPNAILIGDSQSKSISENSILVNLDSTLNKTGWRVSDLSKALMVHPTDCQINKVFVSIGTNGAFSANDKVEDLCFLLSLKFPNAKNYIIVGSYGWGDNKNVTTKEINTYYKRFEKLGFDKLKTEIGYSSSHPTNKTTSIINIGKEVDRIINGW